MLMVQLFQIYHFILEMRNSINSKTCTQLPHKSVCMTEQMSSSGFYIDVYIYLNFFSLFIFIIIKMSVVTFEGKEMTLNTLSFTKCIKVRAFKKSKKSIEIKNRLMMMTDKEL